MRAALKLILSKRAAPFRSIFVKSQSFADRKYQKFLNQEQKETPQGFSLEDFVKAAEHRDFKVKTFIEPIRFFNEVVQTSQKLRLQPQAIAEKIAPFLRKLEENLENFALSSDLQQIHAFCTLLQLRSEVFWLRFYQHFFANFSGKDQLPDHFLHAITSEISVFSQEFREKFRETLPKLIETRYFSSNGKQTPQKVKETVPWLYKWLIFSKGYDSPLALSRVCWEKDAVFLEKSTLVFPVLRRNFKLLPINQKINALFVYFAVFRGEEDEKNVKNLLKLASPSLTRVIPRLSSVQLVQICELYRKLDVYHGDFWKNLETTVISRIETDFPLNYLIKFLQGFVHFRCGSLDLFMEIDRYAGFHAEELTKAEVLQLLRLFAEAGKSRQKFFSLLEEKLWEFRDFLTVSEAIDVLCIYAKSQYLSRKMQLFFEGKLLPVLETLQSEEIAKLLEILAFLQKPTPLLEALKPKVQQILNENTRESAILCVFLNYFEEIEQVSWKKPLFDRVKTLISERKSAFLLKFGELLVKLSRKCVDQEILALFEEKCRENLEIAAGNQRKDLQFILWKLGNAR